MLKVINTANQRSSQAKSFSAVSVAGGKDTKAFDITVNVFNVDSTFGNHSVMAACWMNVKQGLDDGSIVPEDIQEGGGVQ